MGVKIVVYTALFGNIDPLWSVCPTGMGNAEHVVYTHDKKPQVGLWHERDAVPDILPGTEGVPGLPYWRGRTYNDANMTNRRQARYVKTAIHRLEPDADVWIWVDANVRLLTTPERAVDRWLGDHDLAIFNHPDRSCLFDEAAFCAKVGKDDSETLTEQTNRYKNKGMPRGWGLAETRCVMRRNTERMREFGDRWWGQIEAGSVRDQVSLPFVCWNMGIRWAVIPGRAWVRSTNRAFWFRRHRRGAK